ncbi:MAG TPA: tetratricopeptide repeat protein [Gammaproteobacteria bacterium]|nr:tetratricopeptide repeat protein [Gammaproteobacteria bacterium]
MNMIPRMLWLTAALVLSMATVVGADQTDRRLDELFQTLQTSSDTDKLLAAESEIWEIWYESGESEIDELMLQAGELMGSGNLAAAETIYGNIIEQAPAFSEGWNRRATVRFYQHDYDGSLADIAQTLKLEPRHFGAIWGLGMILGLQQDYQRAISAFEKLLEIKPNSQDARPRIEALKQALARESV